MQAKPGLDDTGPISTERTLYIPATQVDAKFLTLIHVWFQPNWIIRSTQLDAQTPAAMQRALASVDPNLPFASFHTMDELLASALALQRIEVALLSSLAVLALLLAALGIFALVSSVITDRQREFGIRIALGSPISDSMLVAGRSGIVPAAIGLVSGLALSLAVLRAMHSALFGVSSYDPFTLIASSWRAVGAGRACKPAACIAHHADSTSSRVARRINAGAKTRFVRRGFTRFRDLLETTRRSPSRRYPFLRNHVRHRLLQLIDGQSQSDLHASVAEWAACHRRSRCW